MGWFFPSSNVNVDLTREVKRNFIKSGHCCRQCLGIVPRLSEFSSTVSLINLLCFFLSFHQPVQASCMSFKSSVVMFISERSARLDQQPHCLCLFCSNSQNGTYWYCAASTQPGYSRDIIFSTQMISCLFLWAVNVKWSVCLPYFPAFWLKCKDFYKTENCKLKSRELIHKGTNNWCFSS